MAILLSICAWFLQFSSLKYPVWWTGFLVYFKLEFYRLQQAEKFSSNREKNPVHQTGYFKLKGSKNQVKKDKGIAQDCCTNIDSSPCDLYIKTLMIWTSAKKHVQYIRAHQYGLALNFWRKFMKLPVSWNSHKGASICSVLTYLMPGN